MKSSSERWIIQTYPPIKYFERSNHSALVVESLIELGQDEDGWFGLKFIAPLDHDFSIKNPTIYKTLTGAIRKVRVELERGGLNPKWYYRIKNMETNEVIPYDIL